MVIGKSFLNRINFYFRVLIILFFFNIALLGQSVHSYNSEPKEFITELVNDALRILADQNLSEKSKSEQITKIALSYIDINALGLYSLGDVRKTISQQQLEQYQSLFQKYFIKSLNSRLKDYSKQKIEVLGYEILSENYTMVNSKILANDKNPEIKVDWRVYTKNKDNPIIRDLVVEGLSLARTQKEEFGSILAANENQIENLFEKLKNYINN